MAKKLSRTLFRLHLIALPILVFMGSGLLAALLDDMGDAMRKREYDRAVRLSGGERDPRVVLFRANALRIQGKFAEAIESYNMVLADRGAANERAKASFGKAYSLMSLKRFGEAAEILRGELARLSGAERMRAHVLLYVNMADELAAGKDNRANWVRAVELYTAALDYGELPADLEYRLRVSRAKSQLALGNRRAMQDQRTEFENLLNKSPKPAPRQEAELRYILGRTHRFIGNPDAAEHSLTLASRIAAGGEIALLAANELLDVLNFPSTNSYEPARGSGKDVSTSRGDMDVASFARGSGKDVNASRGAMDISIPRGDVDVSSLARGRTIVREVSARHTSDARSGELLFRVAMAEMNTGDTANALASFINYASKWPDGENAPESLFRAAEMRFRMNNYSEATQTLRDLLAKYPGSKFWQQAQNFIMTVEYGEAQAAFDKKEYAGAERLWTSYIARYPLDSRVSQAAFAIGRSIELRNEYKRAVDWWDSVWQRWPQDVYGQEASFHAARLLSDELDAYERALAFLQRIAPGRWKGAADERMRELREEFLSLSTDTVFTETMKPALTLKTRNIEKFRVRMYKLDSEAYFRAQGNLVNVEKLDVDLIAPDKEFSHSVADYKQYRLSSIALPVETEGAGAWVVQCSSDTLQSSALLVKSDIALVARAARGQVVVHTTSLSGGRALRDVDIIISNGNTIIASGKTSADGIFVYEAANEQASGNIAVFAKRGNDIAAVSPGWFDQYAPRKDALLSHLVSDKLVYRPGDTARFRLTLRTRGAGLLSIPKGEFTIAVTSPSGIPLLHTTARPDEFGVISGEFSIDRAELKGVCALSVVSSDRAYAGSHTLRVERYQPRETEVRFSQSPAAPLPGDTIEISARCVHLFGEPAAGRSVLWRINQEDWQNGITDSSGNLLITIDSRQRISSRPFSVTVKPSWETGEYTHEVAFSRNDFSLEMSTARGGSGDIWLDSEKPRLRITVTPIPGASAARRVTVITARLGETSRQEISKRDITTDAAGTASLELPALAAGQYLVTASALTTGGESVYAYLQLMSSGAADDNKIYLLPEGRDAESGREMRLRVFSRLDRAQEALVSYESERMVRRQSLLIPPGNSTINFTPGEDLAPGFRVFVDAAGIGAYHASFAEFTLTHELRIELDPGKAKLEPGSDVRLSVRARTPDGKGARASLFLFVIDDSIWSALQGKTRAAVEGRWSGIVPAFFPERGLADARSRSFTPFTYSASTGRRDQNIVALEEDRRKKAESQFLDGSAVTAAGMENMLSRALKSTEMEMMESADMAYDEDSKTRAFGLGGGDSAGENIITLAEYAWFQSALTTDAAGNVEANFTLPKLPARWRVVTVAASGTSFFGDAEHTIDAVSEQYAKIMTPDFMTAGDRLRIPVFVANRAALAKRGNFSWQVLDQQKKIVASGTSAYTVRAGGSAEVFISFTAREAGDFLLGVAGDGFSAAAPVRVLPAGERRVIGASSIVRDTWQKRLAYTARSTERVLSIRALAPEQVLFERISPFRGMGQLAGMIASLVRDSAALEYQKSMRPEDTLRSDQLALGIQGTLRHFSVLLETTWRRERPSDSDLVWLGFALQRSRAVGIVPDTRLSSWTRTELEKVFSSADNVELQALALFGLAGENDTAFAWMNRLYRDRAGLGNRELALLALSLAQAGRLDMGAVLADDIASRFKRENGQANLPGKGDARYRWMSQTGATTALGALALISIAPDDARKTAVVGEALAWLTAESYFGGWPTPAENGLIPLVHAKYLKTQARVQTWQAKIMYNGRELGAITSAAPRALEIPVGDLAADTAVIDVRVEGQGLCFVHIEGGELLPARRSPQRDFPGNFELRLQHAPYTFEGKSIPRGMTIVAAAAEAPTNDFRRVARGARFDVEMRVTVDGSIEDNVVVVELPLPAGAKPLAGPANTGRMLYRESIPGLLRYLVQIVPGQRSFTISESLVADTEGDVAFPGARCYPLALPWKRTSTGARSLGILPSGADVYADYAFSADELYELGKLYYEKADYARAKKMLEECVSRWVLRNNPAREIGLMLLDIAVREENAREIVRHFENMKERYQDIAIPLRQAEAVANAYARLGEQERACQVLDGIIEARFLRESTLSGALLSAGNITEASAFLRALAREYPDGNEEMSALASLAQQLFLLADTGGRPPAQILPAQTSRAQVSVTRNPGTAAAQATAQTAGAKFPGKDWLYAESLSIFDDVLQAAPDSALAQEAAFTAASFLFEMGRYPEVRDRARAAMTTYGESHFKDSFQYLYAGALYFERRFEEAARECSAISESQYTYADGSKGPSRYRDYAVHMLGKIRHGEQRYAEAAKLYEQVRDRFRDARNSIEYLKIKQISLPEITSAAPDQAVTLRVLSRNVREASLVLYKVDFLILCLKQKDLSNVKDVNLSGIRPSLTTNIILGVGQEGMTETSDLAIPLPDREQGAWLVVVKGDGFEQSGMILRSNLVLDAAIMEDGTARASVHDRVSKKPIAGASIRFIPAGSQAAVAVMSDPRGVAESRMLDASMTIAADYKGEYAFQRVSLQRTVPAADILRPRAPERGQPGASGYTEEAMEEIMNYRRSIQQESRERWEQNQMMDKGGLELRNLNW